MHSDPRTVYIKDLGASGTYALDALKASEKRNLLRELGTSYVRGERDRLIGILDKSDNEVIRILMKYGFYVVSRVIQDCEGGPPDGLGILDIKTTVMKKN